ncbi:MAG TPA: GDSL-type esterase/lipase family protein [Polyangia bacterium]|jgi:hypothetical protein|nr:GDSL-type esterase/lipase family protein [Polyangia bacterium]
MKSTHRSLLFSLSAFAVASIAFSAAPAQAAMKVACTGTSAMMGLGSTAGHHVPDEMGKVLGANFTVTNYGVQGTTAIKSVGSSYAATSQYRTALASNPDIVLFWFGGNDSFAGTWNAHKAEFKADYTAMVKAFQDLPTKPKTFLVRLWVFPGGPVQQNVLDKEILPIIAEIGMETNSTVIDYRKLVETHREWFPDGMHPNDMGTLQIGKLFADTVMMTLNGAGADGGAGGGSGGASGADAAADTGPSATDVAVAETPPASTGTGGSGGSPPPASTGGTTGGGSGGATPPSTGTGGAAGSAPGATGSSGGCRIGGASDSGSAPAVLLFAALALLVVGRRRTRA